MRRQLYDVAVIGAGPAGLAAAVTTAEAGLSTALIDASERVGGQYFRHLPEAFHAGRPGAFHHRWSAFEALRDSRKAKLDHLAGHRVWTVERGEPFRIHTLVGERESLPETVTARRLVIATGAYDRSLPFPGWDLPGVMTAGGAQALLKGNLVSAGRRVVVAGTGPFLLPVATGLAAAGSEVAGIFEANPLRRTATLSRSSVASPRKALEAAGYAAALLRHRIPFRAGHAVVAAHGNDRIEAVTVARIDADWNRLAGTERVLHCDALAVGYGFTPQMEIPLQLGCETRLDADGSLVAVVDAAQRTTVPGVWAAGEATGVGGADLALVEGRLAGLAVASPQDPVIPGLLAERRRLRAFAAELQRAYPVRPGWTRWLTEDTLICRCEEVTHKRVVQVVNDLEAHDPRMTKLLSRAGMGRCQGRVCGYAMTCLVKGTNGTPRADEIAAVSKRPIAQPIRLGDLATTTPEE